MSKAGGIFKFGYGVLDDLGFFSPTEKAIDALGQNKFPAKDLYRLEDGKPAGLLSKFGRPVQDEMMFTGLEDAILNVPDGGSITSQELKDYLAKNKTRIEETVKSQKSFENEYEPFNLDVIETDNDRYGIQSFLYDINDDNPRALELFAEVDADANRLGTIQQPLINKIDFDDLSMTFKADLNTDFFESARGARVPDPAKTALEEIERNTENIAKIEFRPRNDADSDIMYKIQGNNNIGYEILGAKQDSDEVINIGRADSFNEAKLQLDGFRRRRNNVDEDKLKPMHEVYTLPGGDNYQEILLKMPEPIDNVASTLGKFDDVVNLNDVSNVNRGASINLSSITGSPSDVLINKYDYDSLKDGNKIRIDTNRGFREIQYNKEKDQVELLKTDYKNYSHTADEENVVVFTRTKDRVDEDGRKILYVEELQSDMSQQGRKKGLVMGQNEKKAFINRNNKAVFGDVLDSIENLKDTTNIADLKGARTSTTTYDDSSVRRLQPSFQNVGFKDTFGIMPDMDYDKAHSFEDIVKKQMTKYKFNELKDNQVRSFSNRGIDKKSAQKLNAEALLQDGIKVPENLYNDVTDYVDMSKFKEKIDAIETVMANKILTKEFRKRPDIQSIAGKAEFDKLQAFNRNMLKRFMGEKEFNKFIKDETNDTIDGVLPFYLDYTKYPEKADNMTALEFYNSLGDDDIIKVIPDSEFNYPHSSETARDRLGGTGKSELTKAEFNESYIQKDLDRKIKQQLDIRTTYGDTEKVLAEGFDYSDNSLDEVYDGIKDLQSNLRKAVTYDVKLRPIGNIPSAPFIGSSERFTELAIKRLMQHAKDNDYDGIAFSSGKIHDKRWNQPELKQYYDVIIPKVAKNLLKGTDAKLEYTDIFLDQESLDEATDLIMNNKRYDYFDRDVNTELERADPLLGQKDGFKGYIGDTPTIYLTPKVKEYIESGVSLYTPIVATGLAGTVANQLMGSEEDIITEEGI